MIRFSSFVSWRSCQRLRARHEFHARSREEASTNKVDNATIILTKGMLGSEVKSRTSDSCLQYLSTWNRCDHTEEGACLEQSVISRPQLCLNLAPAARLARNPASRIIDRRIIEYARYTFRSSARILS